MAVGKDPARVDAVDKVTGLALYPADRVPDKRYMRLSSLRINHTPDWFL